jgi:hypothetical protein
MILMYAPPAASSARGRRAGAAFLRSLTESAAIVAFPVALRSQAHGATTSSQASARIAAHGSRPPSPLPQSGAAVPERVGVNGVDTAPIATARAFAPFDVGQERAPMRSGTAVTCRWFVIETRKGIYRATPLTGAGEAGPKTSGRIGCPDNRGASPSSRSHLCSLTGGRMTADPLMQTPYTPYPAPGLMPGLNDEDAEMQMESRTVELTQQAVTIKRAVIQIANRDNFTDDDERQVLQWLTEHISELSDKAEEELLVTALARRGRHSDRVKRLARQILTDDDQDDYDHRQGMRR